jgi:DNA-directed RNA polymerase subunit RPC12/RpoP
LVTTNPEIAKDWNYKKNGSLLPTQYTAGSNKKFWWKCANGHEWRVSINHRTRGATLSREQKGSQCPYCLNQRVQPGFNDLATTNPEIAKEWNYEKNGSLLPTQYTAGSNIKFWWKCSKGHEWKTSIACRLRGTGCPYCLNHKIIPGENDLASQHPEFIKEWDYEKNDPLSPTQIGSGSQKTVWWICSKCGKKWQARICNRVKHNINCRNCNIRESKRNKNQLKFEF